MQDDTSHDDARDDAQDGIHDPGDEASGADPDEPWFWDLRRARAVRASERGPADQTLGPYPSRHAAEHWRDRVEARNEQWDDDDERWTGDRDGAGGDPPGR